jgi:hypothetical protein
MAHMQSLARFAFAAASAAALVAVPAAASAQEERPTGREAQAVYPIEVEPHFAFGLQAAYAGSGAGAGVRVDIPLAYGLLERVPDNVAVSLGADFLRYDDCYAPGYCGVTAMALPVAGQWNVFVARRVSLFAEGGAFVYHGWFDACRPSDVGCATPSDFGVMPTLAIGGRVYLGRHGAITARVGYPMITLGASFL